MMWNNIKGMIFMNPILTRLCVEIIQKPYRMPERPCGN